MKNIEVTIEANIEKNKFPENIESVEDLHSLEGSIWIENKHKKTFMFCQVEHATWTLIDLTRGNRYVDPFTFDTYKDRLPELKEFTRFNGKVTIKTIQP